MKISLQKLAEITGSEFSGEKNTMIDSVADILVAGSGQISFISNPKYKKSLNQSNASALILSPVLAKGYAGNALINKDPYLTFAKVLKAIYQESTDKAEIHLSAIIEEDVDIAENVNIGANAVLKKGVSIETGVDVGAGCYIGECSMIGKNSILYPNVTLYHGSKIGSQVIIHSGVVIGSDGFGFASKKDKSWFKILQVGNVEIGDDVEIGANTTIDRAALGTTKIYDGVKLDNQVQVGHNVQVGEHTVIAAGTDIAGSSSIGKRCQIGGAVAISGHLDIADDVIITGKSMVIKSIKKPGVYSSGIASDENMKWRRNAARFRQLDEMAKKLNQLEHKLNEKSDE